MANQVKVEFVVLGNDNLERSVDKIEKKIVDTEKSINKLGNSANAAGNAIGQGLGIPLGPAAALTAATAAIALGIHTAMAAAREAADANRVLSSSATEAGLSYQSATEQMNKFAAATGLSDTQAKQTFSSIIQVAKVAGDVGNLDEIQKRFADLAAARGVAAKDLATLSQQILSGQDEALNRLGLADPSKLAEDWAKAHSRTVESMSQTEQVASRLDAVMRKGAMFDGSAADRLASVSGQLTQTEQSLANMTTKVGEAILSNMEFRDLLSTMNDILKEMSLSSDDVAAKLNDGLTPAQIAAEQAGSAWNVVMDGIKNTLNLIPALATAAWDSLPFIGDKTHNEVLDQFQEMAFGAADRRKDVLKDQITAEQKQIELQKKQAAEQKQINADKVLSDAAVTASKVRAAEVTKKLAEEEAKQKQITAVFTDTKTFLDEMNARVNKDNPFVKLFTDADTVMERMQKRFGAFGSEFVGMMAKVENQANEMDLLAARIQSAQKVLDIQAEIRKLQFGQVGTSAEDQRRLGVLDAKISAAKNIPGLEASARAVAEGRLPGDVDSGAILDQQLADIRNLKLGISGTAAGQREAQSKINEQMIGLFQGASPEEQQRLLQGGFGSELSAAFQSQANDQRQAIQDKMRQAEAARFVVEDAEKSMAAAKAAGGFENDAARGQFLSKLRGLSDSELTPQMRTEGVQAMEIEKKREAEKEKKAEENQKLMNEVLKRIAGQITNKGFKTDATGTGLQIEIKDTSGKAKVTGPAMSEEPTSHELSGADRMAMSGM